MPNPDVNLEVARAKRAQGRGLKNSEIGALARADRAAVRPVSNNYRPLGVIISQVNDRIHTLQDIPFGGGQSNELHYNRGGVRIDIDGDGIDAENTSLRFRVNFTNGSIAITSISSSKSIVIDSALLTHDMSIREIDVCEAGVAKKMLVLASAAY